MSESNEEMLDASWEAGLAAAAEANESETVESAEESAEAVEETPEAIESEEPESAPEAEEAPEQIEASEEEAPAEEEAVEEQPAELTKEGEPDKLEQLEALAKELGFEFNGEKVQNAHFVKLRQKAKADRDKLEAKAQERIQQIEDAKAQLEARYQPFEAVRAAAESGDFDALAKSLGHESFQKMALAHLNGSTQEGAQRLKMQREMQELRAQQEAYAKRVQEQQQQASAQQARQQYIGKVAETLGQYKETQAWVSNPEIVEAVVSVQQQSANAQGIPTLSIEQAAQALIQQARTQRDTLSTLLGTTPQKGEEAAGRASPDSAENNKKKTPKTVSQKARVEAGNSADDEEFDNDAWLKRSLARMERAIQ